MLLAVIKAERTGDWQLHLQSVEAMSPYLAAFRHNLYAKCARMYLQEMVMLSDQYLEIATAFENGHHILIRSNRFWAGLLSD